MLTAPFPRENPQRATEFVNWALQGRHDLIEAIARARSEGTVTFFHLLDVTSNHAIPEFDDNGEWRHPKDVSFGLHPDVLAMVSPETKNPLGFILFPNGMSTAKTFAQKPEIHIKLPQNQQYAVAEAARARPSSEEEGVAYVWGAPDSAMIVGLCANTAPETIHFHVSRDIGARAVGTAIEQILTRDWPYGAPNVVVNIRHSGPENQQRAKLYERLIELGKTHKHRLTIQPDVRFKHPESLADPDYLSLRSRASHHDASIIKEWESAWAAMPMITNVEERGKRLSPLGTHGYEYPALNEITHVFCSSIPEEAKQSAEQFARAHRPTQENPDTPNYRQWRTCTPTTLARTMRALHEGTSDPGPIVLHLTHGHAGISRVAFDDLPHEWLPDAIVGSHYELTTLNAQRALPATVVVQAYSGEYGGLIVHESLAKLRDSISRQQHLIGKIAEDSRALEDMPADENLTPIIDVLRNKAFTPPIPVKEPRTLDPEEISRWVDALSNEERTLITIMRGAPHTARLGFTLLLPENSPRTAFAATDGLGPMHEHSWAISLGAEDIDHYLELIADAAPSKNIRIVLGRGRDAAAIPALIQKALALRLIPRTSTITVVFAHPDSPGVVDALATLELMRRTWEKTGRQLDLRTATYRAEERAILTGIVERRRIPENALALRRVAEASERVRRERIRAHLAASHTTTPLMVEPSLPSWETDMTVNDLAGHPPTARTVVILTDPETSALGDISEIVDTFNGQRRESIAAVQCPPHKALELIGTLRQEFEGESPPRIAVCALTTRSAPRVYRMMALADQAHAPEALIINNTWFNGAMRDNTLPLASHQLSNQMAILLDQPRVATQRAQKYGAGAVRIMAAVRVAEGSGLQRERTASAIRQLREPTHPLAAPDHPLVPVLAVGLELAETQARPSSGFRIHHNDACTLITGILQQARHRTIVVAPIDKTVASQAAAERVETMRHAVATYFSTTPTTEDLLALAAHGVDPDDVVFTLDRPDGAAPVAEATIEIARKLAEKEQRNDGTPRGVTVKIRDDETLTEFNAVWEQLRDDIEPGLAVFLQLDDDQLRPITDGARSEPPTKRAAQRAPRPWEFASRPWHHVAGTDAAGAKQIVIVVAQDAVIRDWDKLAEQLPEQVPSDVSILAALPRNVSSQMLATLAGTDAAPASITLITPIRLGGKGTSRVRQELRQIPLAPQSERGKEPVELPKFDTLESFALIGGALHRFPPPEVKTIHHRQTPVDGSAEVSQDFRDPNPLSFSGPVPGKGRSHPAENFEYIRGADVTEAGEVLVIAEPGSSQSRKSALRIMSGEHMHEGSAVTVVRPLLGKLQDTLRELSGHQARISVLFKPGAWTAGQWLNAHPPNQVWLAHRDAQHYETLQAALPSTTISTYKYDNRYFPVETVNDWWPEGQLDPHTPHIVVVCPEWAEGEPPEKIKRLTAHIKQAARTLTVLNAAGEEVPMETDVAYSRELGTTLREITANAPNALVSVVGGATAIEAIRALDDTVTAPSWLWLEDVDAQNFGTHGLPITTAVGVLPSSSDSDAQNVAAWYLGQDGGINNLAAQFAEEWETTMQGPHATALEASGADLGGMGLLTRGTAAALVNRGVNIITASKLRVVLNGMSPLNVVEPTDIWETTVTVCSPSDETGSADALALARELIACDTAAEQLTVETTDPALENAAAELRNEFATLVAGTFNPPHIGGPTGPVPAPPVAHGQAVIVFQNRGAADMLIPPGVLPPTTEAFQATDVGDGLRRAQANNRQTCLVVAEGSLSAALEQLSALGHQWQPYVVIASTSEASKLELKGPYIELPSGHVPLHLDPMSYGRLGKKAIASAFSKPATLPTPEELAERRKSPPAVVQTPLLKSAPDMSASRTSSAVTTRSFDLPAHPKEISGVLPDPSFWADLAGFYNRAVPFRSGMVDGIPNSGAQSAVFAMGLALAGRNHGISTPAISTNAKMMEVLLSRLRDTFVVNNVELPDSGFGSIADTFLRTVIPKFLGESHSTVGRYVPRNERRDHTFNRFTVETLVDLADELDVPILTDNRMLARRIEALGRESISSSTLVKNLLAHFVNAGVKIDQIPDLVNQALPTFPPAAPENQERINIVLDTTFHLCITDELGMTEAFDDTSHHHVAAELWGLLTGARNQFNISTSRQALIELHNRIYDYRAPNTEPNRMAKYVELGAVPLTLRSGGNIIDLIDSERSAATSDNQIATALATDAILITLDRAQAAKARRAGVNAMFPDELIASIHSLRAPANQAAASQAPGAGSTPKRGMS